jgi:uncharacterized protein YjiS (DUF1127 family)
MSTIASILPSLSAGGTFGVRLFAGICRRATATIRDWRTNMRQRRELLMLNNVELRELSLIEADVNREISKPFWKSIQLAGH